MGGLAVLLCGQAGSEPSGGQNASRQQTKAVLADNVRRTLEELHQLAAECRPAEVTVNGTQAPLQELARVVERAGFDEKGELKSNARLRAGEVHAARLRAHESLRDCVERAPRILGGLIHAGQERKRQGAPEDEQGGTCMPLGAETRPSAAVVGGVADQLDALIGTLRPPGKVELAGIVLAGRSVYAQADDPMQAMVDLLKAAEEPIDRDRREIDAAWSCLTSDWGRPDGKNGVFARLRSASTPAARQALINDWCRHRRLEKLTIGLRLEQASALIQNHEDRWNNP